MHAKANLTLLSQIKVCLHVSRGLEQVHVKITINTLRGVQAGNATAHPATLRCFYLLYLFNGNELVEHIAQFVDVVTLHNQRTVLFLHTGHLSNKGSLMALQFCT